MSDFPVSHSSSFLTKLSAVPGQSGQASAPALPSLDALSPEVIIRLLQNAYAYLDGLGVTATTLLALSGFLMVVSLLAGREALGWFLKVDALRKDIARLTETCLQMDAEIRVMQRLMQESTKDTGALAKLDTFRDFNSAEADVFNDLELPEEAGVIKEARVAKKPDAMKGVEALKTIGPRPAAEPAMTWNTQATRTLDKHLNAAPPPH